MEGWRVDWSRDVDAALALLCELCLELVGQNCCLLLGMGFVHGGAESWFSGCACDFDTVTELVDGLLVSNASVLASFRPFGWRWRFFEVTVELWMVGGQGEKGDCVWAAFSVSV